MKIPFRDEGKIRTFSDKVKLRALVTDRPPLSAWLRKLSKWKGRVHRSSSESPNERTAVQVRQG